MPASVFFLFLTNGAAIAANQSIHTSRMIIVTQSNQDDELYFEKSKWIE